jgi:hypothetical protein
LKSGNSEATMPPRRKAADFFPSPELGTEKPQSTEPSAPADPEQRTTEPRRSARLHSSPTIQRSSQQKRKRKSVLETGQEANISPRVANISPESSKSKVSKASGESLSAEEGFVDAQEERLATPTANSTIDASILNKSPLTDEPYMSAAEELGEIVVAEEDASKSADPPSTPRPATTQNTLDNIPSSQPRPRTERSPVPLCSTPTIPPAASFPTSTSLSEVKSSEDSIHVQPPPKPDNSAGGSPSHADVPEDSDDEAPEAISLSQARSHALESQSKISQQTKAQAEKAREKRRHRDRLLAAQKQEQRSKTQVEEIPNSQQSMDADLTSGDSTDAPAPNQAHQAARVARHAEALPSDILQAASATWLKSTPDEISKTPSSSRPKKRKERDDGIRILEEMNVHLAPKRGKIAVTKDKMIMQMGRGERRMYIGRFTR